MKQHYTPVEVKVINFENLDVLTTSSQDVKLNWEGLPSDEEYIFG